MLSSGSIFTYGTEIQLHVRLPSRSSENTLEFCSSVKLLRIVALFSVSSERLHGRKSVLVLSKAVINLDFSSFQQVENLHLKEDTKF